MEKLMLPQLAKLALLGSPANLRDAINCFNERYHQDFFRVIPLSDAYLGGEKKDLAHLVENLCLALRSWGAGKRMAPRLKDEVKITQFFRSDLIQKRLIELLQYKLTFDGFNRLAFLSAESLPDQFDKLLISVLHELSENLLQDNKSATYPMKALLLLTGLMPAYDSQVRAGLGRSGFIGFSQGFKLPVKLQEATAFRIYTMPYLINELYSREQEKFIQACDSSKWPDLKKYPGRLLDAIFFMQSSKNQALLIQLPNATLITQ